MAILSIVVPITKSGKLAKLADLKTVFRTAMKLKPSARWVLDWAKKGYLTLKKQGEVLQVYADRAKTKLLFEIEQGALRLKVLDQELTGGQLLGGIDEAILMTPDGKTFRGKLELYQKEEFVYAKTEKSGGRYGSPGFGLSKLDEFPHLILHKNYKNQKLPKFYEKSQLNFKINNGVIEFENKIADEWYAFVIKSDGTLRIGELVQGVHYYLSDGAKHLRAAGRIKFAKNGHISAIDNSSGHYTPTKLDNTKTVQALYDNDLIPEEYILYLDDIDQGQDFLGY